MELTHTEEDYLKSVFNITERNKGTASTNAIASQLNTSAASVTDMVQRLSEKGLLDYKKYHGVQLSSTGIRLATQLIRSERLWKVFLSYKLKLSWDKISAYAEELKHVNSAEVIDTLSEYLDHPKFDPHGEAIPNSEGKFTLRQQTSLLNLHKNDLAILVGVRNHEPEFLQFLSEKKLLLGCKIEVTNDLSFDFSKEVLVNGTYKLLLSPNICQNLYVRKQH